MSIQKSFFLDKWEIYQKENPAKKRSSSGSRKSTPKIYDCTTCGLESKCRNPKMKISGKGQKKILFVGSCPGSIEDRSGELFTGGAGRLLKRMCGLIGLDFNEDCNATNIISCFPGMDSKGHEKKPTKDQIKCCYDNLEKVIQEIQPKMIICLGSPAIKRIIQVDGSMQFSDDVCHGKVFPYHKYNCWVGCLHSPSFFLYRKDSDKNPDDGSIFAYDLANIVNYLDDPLPQPLSIEGNECITDADEAIAIIEHIVDVNKPTAFDYEATALSSHSEGARILSISITNEVDSAIFIPLGLKYDDGKDVFTSEEQARIGLTFGDFLKSDVPKVVQNFNMEELWSRNLFGQQMNNFIHDTMVTAHVINCHPRTTGLAFQTFEMTGHIYKGMVDVTQLEKEPLEKVCDYNCWDSRYTLKSYYNQISILEAADENLRRFNQFFTDSLPVLANLKDRGVKIDLNQLDDLYTEFTSEMKNCSNTILNTEAAKKFEEIEGKKLEVTSPAQLGKVIYNICKVEKTKKRQTATHKGATSELILQEILAHCSIPDVKTIISSLFTYRKNTKVIERIAEYKRLIDSDGYVHPSFNLNIARSYRSSADRPNIQNVFQRDKKQREFRRCIIPLPGNIFLEVDYDGLEVRVVGMISGDPELIRQLKEFKEWADLHPEGGPNPWDTHRRWAAKLYEVDYTVITKEQRYNSKNKFVFPSIYGAVPNSIAREFPDKPSGFIKNLQEEFWKEYHFIKEWQLRTIHDYKVNGYIELVTGARRPGPLSINKIYNTPIQGPAFHLLLNSLRLSDAEIIKRGLKSRPRFEVHDSITTDTVPEEAEEIIDIEGSLMISKQFEWQRDIPISVSWEMGPNWFDMEPL